MIQKICMMLLVVFFATNGISNVAEIDENIIKNEVFDYFDDSVTKTDIDHFDYVNPNAPKGGKIKNGIEGTFDTINHYLSNGTKSFGYDLVIVTPMYRSPEHIARYYPYLASHYLIPKDYSYILFKINKNATWQDGTPITSEDFVYTVKLLKEKGNSYIKINYSFINDAEAIDKKIVKVNFVTKNNKNYIIPLLNMPIFSKNQFENIKQSEISSTPPLSSGPYRILNYCMGQSITYKKIQNHWTDNLPQFIGRNNFDTIQIDYYRDNFSTIQAFRAGDIDIKYEKIAKNWIRSYNNIENQNRQLKKTTFANNIPSGMGGLVFNTRKYPFNDRLIRKAITYALDFSSINKNLLYNSYTRSVSYYTNSVYSAKDKMPSKEELMFLEKYKDQLPPELFEAPFSLPNSNPHEIKESLKIASEILQKAGWTISKNNKLVNKNNEPLEIKIMLSSKNFPRIANAFAQSLERLGISAQVIQEEPTRYKKRVHDFDFDMILEYMSYHNILGINQHGYWHSSNADIPGSRNYPGVKNHIVDELLDKISNTSNLQNLITYANSLDRVLLYNYYILPLWNPIDFRFVYWDNIHPTEKIPKYELDILGWWSMEANNQKKETL